MLAGSEARLAPELRELLILRVAWRTRSGYEWMQHSRMGVDAGLSPAQVEAAMVGPSSPVWTQLERALVAAADELIDVQRVADPTWSVLAAHLEPAELFEVLFVVGGYLCLAGVLNSIGVQGTLPGAPGGSAGHDT